MDTFMQSPLFAALDAEGAAALHASLAETDVPKGDVLFHEGEPGDRMYVIVDGKVCPIHKCSPRTLSLAEVFDLYLTQAQQRGKRSWRSDVGRWENYLSALAPLPLDSITPELIQRVLDEMHPHPKFKNRTKPLSAATRRQVFALLSIAGGVALALALPEPRQAGGGAQLERLGLLPPGDLQGLVEERLRLRGRIGVHVEENLRPQPVQLGIVVVLSLLLGSCDAEGERAQGVVVAPDLPEALGEQDEELGRSEPAPVCSQLAHRLLHLRDARLALPRFDPREASQEPPQSQVQRKPELLGETHEFFGAFPRPVELAALDMDNPARKRACARLSGCSTRFASATAASLNANARSGWPRYR